MSVFHFLQNKANTTVLTDAMMVLDRRGRQTVKKRISVVLV